MIGPALLCATIFSLRLAVQTPLGAYAAGFTAVSMTAITMGAKCEHHPATVATTHHQLADLIFYHHCRLPTIPANPKLNSNLPASITFFIPLQKTMDDDP